MKYQITEENNAYIVIPEINIKNIMKESDPRKLAHNRDIDKNEEKKELERQHRKELDDTLKKKTDKIDELLKMYKHCHTQEERKAIQFEIQKFELQKEKLLTSIMNFTQREKLSYYSEEPQSKEEKDLIMKLIESV